MNKPWITTAEVQVEPGDMSSGHTLGFMKVTMWASREKEMVRRLRQYLGKYSWTLVSTENTRLIDRSMDYGDKLNQMIDDSLGDENAIRLGTYYSYKPS